MKRMHSGATGATSLRKAAAACLLVGLGAPALAQAPIPVPREAPAAVRLAESVPLPRPNPQRRAAPPPAATAPASADPISALIAAGAAPPPALYLAPDPPPIQTAAATSAAPAIVSTERSLLAEAAFKVAVRLFDNGDVNAALLATSTLSPVDAKIIKWLVAVYKSGDVSSARIDAISRELADWPGQTLLRTRFEEALAREKSAASEIIRAFGDARPVTDDGTLLLARAYLATGKKAEAAALIRPRWRTDRLTDDFESAIRKDFAALLTKADHKLRMDRMLYAEDTARAMRAAGFLDANQQALAKAVTAVIKRDAKAGATLAALPRALHKDPLHLYSRIQVLRRAEKIGEAAELMLTAPRDAAALVDPDAWWVERRVLTRALIERRDYRTAYRVAAGHAAESSSLQAEAEFHAGWLALQFLHDPATASRHFAAIQTIASMPLSLSRAEYWLGRAAAKRGDRAEATRQFQRAAAYPTTYYGQLALAALGARNLPLRETPKPDAAARKRFASLELVQVIERLVEIKRDDRKQVFMRHLADTLTDPAQLALLVAMVDKEGDHNLSLQLGKNAASRGLAVDNLAFPTGAIPKSARIADVDRSVVYAIARQESAFHTGAVSRAGARGLLQLMPATARQVAQRAGLSYSAPKLTSDPAYNATLGAHYLSHLMKQFDGSYVMTFAAYNAGKSRVDQWVKLFGDPRDPGVDVVNWVESIPFTETRNYVQRVMENVQVYRARLGSPALAIEADLKRGGRR